MGMDVIGNAPKTKQGEYFRNNHLWWHPLWCYIGENCDDILTPEQIHEGHWNDGVKIHSWQAELVANRLYSLIKTGEPRQIEQAAREMYETFPKKPCEVCDGTGLIEYTGREGELITCLGCGGKGIRREVSDDWEPFSEDNVKHFADFCNASGGFSIY